MRLRQLREAKKENQQKLAILLNTSQSMISRYETGEALPNSKALMILAGHYHVSVDYLIGYSDSKLPYSKSELSEQEQEMLHLFKQLDSLQREKALSYVQGMMAVDG